MKIDSARLQTLVKPLLRGVLFKVHPDFFAHDPVAKRINQASVQRLQDLLAPVLRDNGRSAASRNADLSSTPLEFICKSIGQKPQDQISFAFTHTRSGNSGAHRVIAQRTRDLVALCSKLNVSVSTETLGEIEEAIGRAAPTASGHSGSRVADIELRAARAREARENYDRKRNAPDPNAILIEKLRHQRWWLGDQRGKSAKLELDRSKVFFDSLVNPKDYVAIVRRIERALEQLHYSHWHHLPLMIVKSWRGSLSGSKTKYPGFVIMPADVPVKAGTFWIIWVTLPRLDKD
ncbi:hypothetical protein GGI15_000587 [Coemansia interrupta]|uniref:DUF4460 domain-containing protein n=1 Tax=Coemansia interrupta TaxID=1126814 RepID=A0A9W8HSV0_9FUNG|nr:hypothetical protein GGI15_000587 [Coemansia interrupta]